MMVMMINISNSTMIIEELSQLNVNIDTKEDGMHCTKSRLGESLNKKCENQVMREQYIRSIDRQLISK
jgi:hypothetical protein